ncbi:uncharacterized protein LOC111027607 [Myzus persicae]|uniref:uncharacterized protein LOC111027607 n=1 Tax=Myzus persicae TaxID=13164 RepID=UPI000B937B6E|nr:uncharacterized protein LOC111027607 [Myzus persicae]XP_022161698.1 uncharacterized protein LOC111027607 [Myzus persicae]
MSVLKNVGKIANFIQQKYPTLEFGNISVSNEAISDICIVILKKDNCKKAKKKNLVMALNNPNSALRKFLVSNSDDKLHFHNILQDNGYSKNDFCTYQTEVVNSICKMLKMNCSRKNQHRIFQRCQESFQENEISGSPKELSQKETTMLGQVNELNESTTVCVKRKLLIEGSPQKENNNTSDLIVDEIPHICCMAL